MDRVCYRFAGFTLDPGRHLLRRGDRPVHLAPQPFSLLVALASARGELVRRETIARELWEEGVFVDAEAGINFCVRTLRRALAESAGELPIVETVPRLGYRLAVEVSELASEPADAAEPEPVGAERAPLANAPAPAAAGGRSRPRLRVGAAILAAALVLGWIAFLLIGAGGRAGTDLRLAVASDGAGDSESIARAFEAEVAAALLEAGAGRGEISVGAAPASQTGARLEAKFQEIPAGIRAEFRLLRGVGGALLWQWTVEMDGDRWFYGRSTLAEGVGRAAAQRLWPRAEAGAAADAATTATLDRLRARLDAAQPGTAAATAAELADLLARAPQVAAVHALEARAKLSLWDAPGAERAARRALELDRDSAQGTLALASALSAQARHGEAVEAAFSARRLAPLDPAVQIGLARVLLFAGRAEQVVEVSRAGLAVYPELAPLWRWRYLALLEKGDVAAAEASLRRARHIVTGIAAGEEEVANAPSPQEALRAAWRAELEGRPGAPPTSSCLRAGLHALLGEREAALAELTRAIEQHEEGAVYLEVAPWFRALRSDPRFQELVRRVEREGRG